MYRLQAAWPVAQLVGAGACDPLAERVAVRADELDGCSRVEAALAADDPDAEQARPALDERAAGALVDVQTPCDRLAEAQPELERGIAAVPRRVAGASPARIGPSTSSPWPAAITVGIPAALAICAASTLLPIPPRPSSEPAPSSASTASAPSRSSSAPGVPGVRE